jgi:hypothetical protein
VSDISETLGEQQGYHEIAEQENREREPHGVLHVHNRSTPLTINDASAKNAPVRITNTRSDMHGLQSSGGLSTTTKEVLMLARGCVDVLTGS